MKQHQYWVYIITNKSKSTLYIGVTNNLKNRLRQHYENRGINKTFAGRYFCYHLVYFEFYKYIEDAINREKQLKKWSRKKKKWLIEQKNKNWDFLNDEI